MAACRPLPLLSLLLLLLLLDDVAAARDEVSARSYVDGPGPGHYYNTSKNDTGVVKAALTGTYTFNNESNDAFYFKASAIDAAKRQVVKGIRYILEVEVTRTVCRKMEKPIDLASCDFQPNGVLYQTFFCHFEVWSIPWMKQMKTTDFFCKP
ncbi:cystatin-F [Denticeps clupeoides]|uniref:Cystatin domain-containing protein n=1 Tax=Denticeps clupeoides TaxID=299321 RepID=A0AAY4BGK1_9TELE|nr:cystatin-F [Denticeps clupeoides]